MARRFSQQHNWAQRSQWHLQQTTLGAVWRICATGKLAERLARFFKMPISDFRVGMRINPILAAVY